MGASNLGRASDREFPRLEPTSDVSRVTTDGSPWPFCTDGHRPWHLAASYVADTIRAHFPTLGIAGETTVASMRRKG